MKQVCLSKMSRRSSRHLRKIPSTSTCSRMRRRTEGGREGGEDQVQRGEGDRDRMLCKLWLPSTPRFSEVVVSPVMFQILDKSNARSRPDQAGLGDGRRSDQMCSLASTLRRPRRWWRSRELLRRLRMSTGVLKHLLLPMFNLKKNKSIMLNHQTYQNHITSKNRATSPSLATSPSTSRSLFIIPNRNQRISHDPITNQSRRSIQVCTS